MTIYVKFDTNFVCKKILQELLAAEGIVFTLQNLNEVALACDPEPQAFENLRNKLAEYGISVIDDQKQRFVQKIKDLINESVWNKDEMPNMNMSRYLSENLDYSYGYLTNIFSEVTLTSIESYVIMQKIERAKHLLLYENRSLTEISRILGYSSVAHLSAQFKKNTGLTPSLFQSIIKKRKQRTESVDN